MPRKRSPYLVQAVACFSNGESYRSVGNLGRNERGDGAVKPRHTSLSWMATSDIEVSLKLLALARDRFSMKDDDGQQYDRIQTPTVMKTTVAQVSH